VNAFPISTVPCHRRVLAGSVPALSDLAPSRQPRRDSCCRGTRSAPSPPGWPAPGGLGLRVWGPLPARGSGGVTPGEPQGLPCRFPSGLPSRTPAGASTTGSSEVLIWAAHLCLGPWSKPLPPPSPAAGDRDEQRQHQRPGALLPAFWILCHGRRCGQVGLSTCLRLFWGGAGLHDAGKLPEGLRRCRANPDPAPDQLQASAR